MAKKSIKVNAVLNGIKTILSLIFPLITFPYISRILGVENLGKVNFSNSIISYFILVAGLGISTYAIREGTAVRNDREKFNAFASQVFTINVISTLVSYLGLFTILLLVPTLQEYKLLLFILGMSIVFTTIGVDWIYSIYEEYFYILVRSLIFQVISLFLLFLMVRSSNDYYFYAVVLITSNVGSNLLNFFLARKYCDLRLTTNINFKRHLKPIIIIFSTQISTIIYVNSDITMLGLMTGDYSVGIYSVSVKVYSIMKMLLAAVIIVALPRLSFYVANKEKEKYYSTLTNIFNSLLLLVLPAVIGIIILSNEIILIISGSQYIEANFSLRILSLALIFSTFASFATTTMLLPMKKEKYILVATITSAIINIVLNLFLIPLFQQNGAAVTTAFSEFVVLAIAYYYSRKYIQLNGVIKNLTTSFIGCIAIVIVSIVFKYLISNIIIYTILTAVCSILVYYTILLLLRNTLAWELTKGFKAKLGL